MSGAAKQEITRRSEKNAQVSADRVSETPFNPFALWAGGLDAFCAEGRGDEQRLGGRS